MLGRGQRGRAPGEDGGGLGIARLRGERGRVEHDVGVAAGAKLEHGRAEGQRQRPDGGRHGEPREAGEGREGGHGGHRERLAHQHASGGAGAGQVVCCCCGCGEAVHHRGYLREHYTGYSYLSTHFDGIMGPG